MQLLAEPALAHLLSFVGNKLFDFNRNVMPHGLLEASHVAKELLFRLLWHGRPPISDKHDRAGIDSGLANTFTTKATLVSEFRHLSDALLGSCRSLSQHAKRLRSLTLREALRTPCTSKPSASAVACHRRCRAARTG
jgi:hypothetical protein